MTTWSCWREPEHTVASHPDFGWPQCIDCGAAPPYHERPAYLDERLELTIYVPEGPIRAIIAPRSGVVGLPYPKAERAAVYYEGWVNGPAQYADRDARGLWEAGIEHAASRMVCQYPTAATLAPELKMLTAIGVYRPRDNSFTITNEEALEAWLTSPTG